MSGYKNGKVEIFYGDNPPSNLNILWQKRIVTNGTESSELMQYNNNLSVWESLKNKTIQDQIDAMNSLNGSNYVMVYGTGTPTENSAELEESFNKVVLLNPTTSNVVSIIVAPGDYGNPTIPDIIGVEIKSLTGKNDVIINGVGSYGINKSSVGLENVDNTSDANKPISILVQSELDLLNSNVNSISTGLIYQNPVESIVSVLPVSGLTIGQRYILDIDNKIYTATSTTKFDTGMLPIAQWAVMVKDVSFIYSYNSTEWVDTGLVAFPDDILVKSSQILTENEQLNVRLNSGIDSNNYLIRKGFNDNPQTSFDVNLQKVLKNIRLIGDWDYTKNYQISSISRNHLSSRYRIIIKELDNSGLVLSTIYDSLPIEVTEAGENKLTIVEFDNIKGKKVICTFDYNQMTDTTTLSTTTSNYILSQNCITAEEFPIIYSDYSNPLSNIESILTNSFKSIVLSGDWDITKNYQIGAIYRNHATYGYRIIIHEVDDNGIKISDVYDTLAFTSVVETGNDTYVIFPKIGNKQIVANIDYTKLLLDSYVSSVGINCNLNNNFIKAIDNAVTIDSFKVGVFFDSGLKTANKNQKLIATAIKSIALIGKWNKTLKYVVRALGRNHATYKYRLIIEVLNSDGTYAATYTFDSDIVDLTEAGAGKTTTYLFTSTTVYAERQVLLTIDYNLIPDGSFLNINGSNPYVIRPEYIHSDGFLKGAFLYKNFNNAINSNQLLVADAISSLQLVGDWDTDKFYFVRYITRSYGATPTWRIIIGSLSTSGDVSTEAPYYIYNISLTGVTESTIGTTHMNFGWYGNKNVIAEIDWNKFTANTAINLAATPPNYIINPTCIKSIASEYEKQSELSVSGMDFLQERTVINWSEPNLDVIKPSLSAVSKKGFLCFRTDDNHIMKEIVAVAEKFGFRYNFGVNIAVLDYIGQENYFRALQAKGHELCDHTPNHNTLQVTIKNEWLPIFTPYIGNGIDRIVNLVAGVTSTVIFTKEFMVDYNDVQFGDDNAFQTVAGTNRITGDFTALRQFTGFPTYMAYIFIQTTNGSIQQGWNIVKTTTTSEITISDELGNALNFDTDSNISVYIIESQGYEANEIKVTLTENATYLLMLAGQLWFQYYGLKRPSIWIQPGGDHPWMLNVNLEKALDKLGMISAESFDDMRNLTYNFADKFQYKRTGTWWEAPPLHFDYANETDLQESKELIADYVATKNIRTLASHYLYNTFGGATAAEKKLNYINHLHSIFEFCYKNGIEFITFSERKKLLLDAETNKYANIMPPLHKDIVGRNKPDGYILTASNILDNAAGMPESKNYAILINPEGGRVFDIPSLGGLEKGLNEFSFYAKGNFNAYMIIYDEDDNLIINQEITSSSSQYTKILFTFNIPLTTNYIRILFDFCSVNAGDCYVTNFSLNAK